MSQAWERTHRRYRLVQGVLADVARSGVSVLPRWDAEIGEEFGGLAEFLSDVQRRWYEVVNARLDVVLEDAPNDPREAALELWRQVARQFPAGRALLVAYADHPVVADGDAHHLRRLHAATGLDLWSVQRSALAEPVSRSRGAAHFRFWSRSGRR